MYKNKNELALLAYKYSMNLANQQPYKIQFMAMKNYFKKHNFLNSKGKLKRHYRQYMKEKFGKNQLKDCKMTRDFAFKHDFMTPRQSMLFKPKAYAYYTNQVFNLAIKIKKLDFNQILDFSTNHVHVFYTGILRINPYSSDLWENSNYKKSYRNFQDVLNTFKGNKVLKIDVQNFFLGITNKRLKNEFMKLSYYNNPEFFNIQKFLKNSGYDTLPQSQGSLASSILSQFYLTNFTNYLESISLYYNLEIARYVDDTYIKLPKDITQKDINEIINGISSELWKYGLNLNIDKTKILNEQEFKRNYNFETKNVSEIGINQILTPKNINDKVYELLKYDGKKLLEFLSNVRKIHKKYGNDMNRYKKLSFKYFNVNNEDANKVQNSLIFGNKLLNMLSNNTKKKIINYTEIINFDPGKYVTFLLRIEKSIGIKNNINIVETYIKKNIHKRKYYSVREGIIDSNFYIQTQNQNNICSLNRIIDLNNEFYNFILGYIK